ncbi:hypothetical protein [Methylophaga sp.]|uniref:hypothetical protein n=1 Tax=Methylophaga sp. TaxID=2024840 RepID=UPI003F69C138
MHKKTVLLLIFTVFLSACDETQTFILEPVARQQLYTLKLDGGQSRLCGVDTHPIDPIPVLGLGATSIQVGYKSYNNGGRAFCEIERGYEYHGEIFFDPSPLYDAGISEINTLTLTANLRRSTDNTCLRADDMTAPVYAVEMLAVTDAFSNDESEDVYPQEATGGELDGEILDYREWITRGSVDDIDETVGVNRLTVDIGTSGIDWLESDISRELRDWKAFSVVATPNPDWRGKKTCLARLTDVQLIVVAPDV